MKESIMKEKQRNYQEKEYVRNEEKRKILRKKEEDEIKFIVLFESRSNIQIFKYSSFHYTSIFFYLRSKHFCVSPPPPLFSYSPKPILQLLYNSYPQILFLAEPCIRALTASNLQISQPPFSPGKQKYSKTLH